MNPERAGDGLAPSDRARVRGWAPFLDHAGALLILRLGFDLESVKGWHNFSGSWAPGFQFSFVTLILPPFLSKPWFLYLSDEDEKNLPTSVGKVIISS